MSTEFKTALLRLKESLAVESDKDVAEFLGMTASAFFERKRRHAFPEDKLRAAAQKHPELRLDVDRTLGQPATASDLATRIKSVMATLGLKQKALSQQLGVPLDRVKSLTSGRASKLTPDELATLTDRMRVNPLFLISGTTPVTQEQAYQPHATDLSEELSDIAAQALRLERGLRETSLAVQLNEIATELRRTNERLDRIEATVAAIARSLG
ncbi:MAG TPA: hypothetical protein VLF18_08605 [Tahibacter sp.]|uniref:hypothetical protein n=1 Tax=Tahibacter sp. TaxID=2056211 RepID=UPI002CEFBD4C|nr:hypothetical protein [Tahibacter sp.]HSX60244.1 hypothetical protein [Tahibacter sp.]